MTPPSFHCRRSPPAAAGPAGAGRESCGPGSAAAGTGEVARLPGAAAAVSSDCNVCSRPRPAPPGEVAFVISLYVCRGWRF